MGREIQKMIKNCPLCNSCLVYFPSKMRGFSWTDPYIECTSCGFFYREELNKHKDSHIEMGKSGFERDEMRKEQAEFEIKSKFFK